MNLFPALEKQYSHESRTALQAQRLAHEISQAPIVFAVSRLMVKFGILQMLLDSKDGMTIGEVAAKANLPHYAVQCLMESSLTIGTILLENERFTCSKAGWFLLNDPMVKVNMDFNHDVNYLGMFSLEEALLSGKPDGLRVFGSWETIYEGLSQLPPQVQKSWFAFDHYYSDQSFDQALQIVFAAQPRTLLDVGGNTGRWAMRCVDYDQNVKVTIMDLPQQIEMMRQQTSAKQGAERIFGHACNLLDHAEPFPKNFDAIWLSQFLDCFSEEQVTSILSRAAAAMSHDTKLYIMETFWDRQRFETAAYALTQISLYFTALANGCSKMYHSQDMMRCINNAGLTIEQIHDGIGKGHSIVVCTKVNAADLLPQKEPFVMVDRLLACSTTHAKTSLSIRCDNIFVENGMLTQSGVIENVAQTCAAMLGYNNRHQKVRIGMIGSISDFEFQHGAAMAGSEIFTEIMVEAEIGNVILLNANVLCNGKTLACGKMKVVLTDIEV